ncbi:MAG: hypothetical protein CMH30_00030 [Micavibrio sp.]|nr:hypothetical protein [Micavibrio sp.]
MSTHIYSSWGRTRSPKNLAGTPGTAVTLSVAGDLLGITATTTGYATENQRYLHVLTEDNNADAPGTIKVYGYTHAFQRWFELPQSFNQVGANSAPTAVTIPAPADSGHADAADITPDEREYRTYEILGIDRVAFVGSDVGTNAWAACSTF